MNAAALLHLLQFASPALPIGGYSYSQGLETAIDSRRGDTTRRRRAPGSPATCTR